jgi:hypothetical protein
MIKLAEVVTVATSNRRDIPATLRVIADQIESGEFPDVVCATLVVNGKILDVCHLGEGTSTNAHLMLCLGQRKLEEMIIKQMGEL